MDGSAWIGATAETGAARVFRGESWLVIARGVRSAYRGRNEPGNRYGNLGFRCARVQEA